jgi:hypothetical protein
MLGSWHTCVRSLSDSRQADGRAVVQADNKYSGVRQQSSHWETRIRYKDKVRPHGINAPLVCSSWRTAEACSHGGAGRAA